MVRCGAGRELSVCGDDDEARLLATQTGVKGQVLGVVPLKLKSGSVGGCRRSRGVKGQEEMAEGS